MKDLKLATGLGLLGCMFFALHCLPISTASAQVVQVPGVTLGSTPIPGLDYYNAFPQYYMAEYRRAADAYADGARTSFRVGSTLFLDSCCYRVMNGECRFQVGDFAGAITQYEDSIQLYNQYTRDDWQARVTQPTINVQNGAIQRANVTWYKPQRNVVIPGLPDKMQMLFGRLDAAMALQTGGALANPEYRAVNVIEIMRTVAIALQRRRWLKGSICEHDALSQQTLDALKMAGAGDDSILSKFNLVLYGIALASNGDRDQAVEILGRSLQFGGGMEHPLTAIAMLELARLYNEADDTSRAAALALEASYVAAIFQQYDIVEQALSLGTEVHLRKNRTVYPPLEQAIAWAGRENARQLQVALAIRLADCLAETDAAPESMKLLDDTQRTASRTDLLRGPLAGRIGYLRAVNLFATGNFEAGREALAAGLQDFAKGSRWLYQLSLVNSNVVSGQSSMTTRQADLLYGLLLGDPQEIHWRTDPIEPMSYLASNHLASIEAWLEIAIENRAYDRAIEIAELLRRHRFYSTLPLFGRLMSMRWIMHGPDESMDDQSLAQRTDFLTRTPAYAELAAKAKQVRQNLLAIPLQPTAESDREIEQRDLFVELMQISQQQEALLASHSLKREPANMRFPAQSGASSLRAEMPQGSSIMYIAATERNHWIFLISARGTKLIAGHKNRDVATMINRTFKAFSLDEKELTAEQLQSTDWRKTVLEQTGKMFPEIAMNSFPEGSELIIVPDGFLWYLPIEALLFGADADTATMLGDVVKTRYAPTLDLAVTRSRVWKQPTRTGIFPGLMGDGLDAEASKTAATGIASLFVDTGIWPDRLMIPGSLLSNVADQFVVLTKMVMPERGGALALLPVQKDHGRTGNNLAAWLSLPMEGVDTILLPGYESAGAVGIRGADGMDMFLTSVGLMASGSRTVLISRWPTRGQSALAFTEEYLNQTQKRSPVDALHESQLWMREQDLDFKTESRIKTPNKPLSLKCEHPFFWAGYIVLDIPVINPPEIWSETSSEESDLTEADGDAGKPEATEPGAASGDKMDDAADDKADGGSTETDPEKKADLPPEKKEGGGDGQTGSDGGR